MANGQQPPPGWYWRIGWGVHATLLALGGVLTALTAFVLWIWQRECLTGVSYRRTLGQQRAMFGEQVSLDIELVNDKLLPLTWLHVADGIPAGLTLTGGSVVTAEQDNRPQLHHLLPMLPFQRVRRHLVITCDHRGEHTFGPAALRSGNPLGYREKYATNRDLDRLLVYPKLFRLGYPRIPSRVPLGQQRARLRLIGDPSRPIGVREYRPGDPIRHVDWRASARSTGLLVQVLEPTAALRVVVFTDAAAPSGGGRLKAWDVAEFVVAVTASIVADLADRAVSTGLYSSGTVSGRPVALAPSTAPAALPTMLESLARSGFPGRTSIADLLLAEGPALQRGASLVFVAADFPDSTVRALAEVRRRLPVTIVWIAGDHGQPPPPGLADTRWGVAYRDDWKDQDVLELAE
jgi:uncharacterized protein (DUF58 family)